MELTTTCLCSLSVRYYESTWTFFSVQGLGLGDAPEQPDPQQANVQGRTGTDAH